MTTNSGTRTLRRDYYESYDHWNYVSGQDPTVVSQFSSYSDVDYSFTGQDMPGWRDIIRVQGNAMNAASGYRTRVESTPTFSTYGVIQSAMIGSPKPLRQVTDTSLTQLSNYAVDVADPSTTAIATTTAQNMAKGKFVSNARQAMTQVQSGPFIAEIGKTLHMLRHPMTALRAQLGEYLGTVKKRGRGLRNSSNSKKNAMVANTWLEYTFGWTPLLYDIKGAANALRRLAEGRPPLYYVKGFGQSSRQVSQSNQVVPVAGGSVRFQQTIVESATCHMYGQVILSNDPMPAFRDAFGLRPHDFLPTIWELIPYSFVVDYFTNIGDIISCATFSTSNLHWWGQSVVGKRLVFHTSPAYTTAPPVNTVDTKYTRSLFPGKVTKAFETFDRSSGPSLVPGLRLKVPGAPKPYVNVAALIAQAASTRI